jgi:uncharacterized protein YjbI with pentapeptide repeats
MPIAQVNLNQYKKRLFLFHLPRDLFLAVTSNLSLCEFAILRMTGNDLNEFFINEILNPPFDLFLRLQSSPFQEIIRFSGMCSIENYLSADGIYETLCKALLTKDVKTLNFSKLSTAFDELKTKYPDSHLVNELIPTELILNPIFDKKRPLKEKVHLYMSNLSSANLSSANLQNNQLYMANLFNADMRFSRLLNANLSNTNLHKANLCGADICRANFTGADLSESKMEELFADAWGAVFNKANLSKATLDSSKLTKGSFENAILIGIRMYNTVFIECNFRFANLSNANLTDVSFENCNLTYVNFSGTNLAKVKNLHTCQFLDLNTDMDGLKNQSAKLLILFEAHIGCAEVQKSLRMAVLNDIRKIFEFSQCLQPQLLLDIYELFYHHHFFSDHRSQLEQITNRALQLLPTFGIFAPLVIETDSQKELKKIFKPEELTEALSKGSASNSLSKTG